ncbi:class I SAM-dependent methyltransferase [Flavisolibacter sp. BT320]|nr:class I SAM-dependent methyltransferase [Flavisolibacter longurius]
MTSKENNINDSFFSGHYKEVWRKLIPPGLSEAECSFIEDVANLKQEDAVLDLMCGYGRHALELGRRGYHVTAIDNLQAYTDEINEMAATEKLPVKAMTSGALEVSLEQTFKAAICMGNSFAFFNSEDAAAILQKIASHLTACGTLILNTWMIAEIAIKHFQEREWYYVEDYKYLLDYQYHFSPNRIESEHTLIAPDGLVEVIKGVDYIFTLQELEAMLQTAGLKMKSIYSTPRKKPFRMGDNKAYIVIEKN